MKFKLQLGVVSLPLIIGLVLMAVALPFAGKLALNNQDIRNRAAGSHPPNCTCTNGKYTGSGCVALGYNCALPTTSSCKCEAGNFKGSACGANSGKPCVMPPTTGCPNGCPAGLICKNDKGECAKAAEVACRLYGCKEPNQTCTTNGCVAVGTGCVMDSQCGGLTCVKGICRSKCVMDSECGTTQMCNSGFCVTKPIPTSTTVRTCICTNGVWKGNSCDVNTGKPCSTSKCTNDSDCGAPYKCVSGACKSTGCASDSNCPTGSHCTSFKCVKDVVSGMGCTYDSDCASKHCIGNYPNRKCAASEYNRPDGSSCLLSRTCSSGNCSFGTCKPSNQKANLGSACTSHSDCSSNNCDGGKCTSWIVPVKCIDNRDCPPPKVCKKIPGDEIGRDCL